MVLTICPCDYGNFGMANCIPVLDNIFKLLLGDYFDEDGNEVKLDLSAATKETLDDQYFRDLVADGTFNVTPQIYNYDAKRGDQEYFEVNGGRVKFPTQKGMKAVEFIIVNAPLNFIAKWEAQNSCEQKGFMAIDEQGNLGAMGEDYRQLLFAKIQKGSFWATEVQRKDKDAQYIKFGFSYDPGESDAKQVIIKAEDMDANLKVLNGLIDVDIVKDTSFTQTGTQIKVVLDTKQGSVLSPILLKYGDPGDFTMTLLSDGSTVGVSTIDEGDPGHMLLTFATALDPEDYELSAVVDGYVIRPLKVTGI